MDLDPDEVLRGDDPGDLEGDREPGDECGVRGRGAVDEALWWRNDGLEEVDGRDFVWECCVSN